MSFVSTIKLTHSGDWAMGNQAHQQTLPISQPFPLQNLANQGVDGDLVRRGASVSDREADGCVMDSTIALNCVLVEGNRVVNHRPIPLWRVLIGNLVGQAVRVVGVVDHGVPARVILQIISDPIDG